MEEEVDLDELILKYPSGSSRLEKEIHSLKRKINETDLSEKGDSKQRKASDNKNTGFSCLECSKCFTKKQYLTRHLITHSKIKCLFCPTLFTRADSRKRHMQRLHRKCQRALESRRQFSCVHCQYSFRDYDTLYQHVVQKHPLLPNTQHGGQRKSKTSKSPDIRSDDNSSIPSLPRENNTSQKSALNNSAVDYVIYPQNEEIYDLLLFFANKKEQVENYLNSRIQQLRGIKWYLSTQVEMYKETSEGEIQTDSPHFRSMTYSSVSTETFDTHSLNQAFQKMSASLENYLKNSSGWNIRKILHLTIHSVIFKPISASSYIELPTTLKKSRCLLNIRNEDHKCFLWSVLAAIFPANSSSPEQVQNYTAFENELNMKGIDYPVALSKIDMFERQNESISVNVFAFDDGEIVPLRITKCMQRLRHINLLYLKNNETTHYALILDLNAFLSRTKSVKNKLFFCSYCLHGFVRQNLLDDHLIYCSTNQAQKIILPEKGKTDKLEFKDFQKVQRVPFVIYADFETLNLKMQHCAPRPGQSSTTQTTKLQPCSFAYKVVSIDENFSKPTVLYRGSDASRRLIECLLKEQSEIESILNNISPIEMTEADELAFHQATQCGLCNKPFGENDIKVKHHQHFSRPTGKDSNFIAAAHQACNLACKQIKSFIPVIFHNLKHFDGHILCQSLGLFKEKDIKCIPQNMERYISFSLGQLRFIDSFQFLASSLETLVEDLISEGEDAFTYFWKEFPHERSKLLLRKGVYPYDYMDSENRFNETELPSVEDFYSEIRGEGISEVDYKHAREVYETFGLKNLGEYHDLYLKTDVVLLCDVFEQFRTMCLQKYGLDACHFYSSPGLSWAACLKMTGVRLELLSDIDMINFFERGTRGGVSQISHRFKKANNPMLGEEHYDDSKKTSWIQYLDMNNLYGLSMTLPLPTGGFRFLTEDELKHFDVFSIAKDSPVGYVCDVSLRYPSHLHQKHSDLPLAPIRKRITSEDLSPYARKLWKKMFGKKAGRIENQNSTGIEIDDLADKANVEKLVTTLEDKDHYVVHYQNLQLYLQLGMEIRKIHRVLEFQQAPWMKPYIELNTEERKKAKSSFQKNFYKLMNVSVFGKTMENLKKRVDVRLVQSQKKLSKLTAKPTFKGFKIFDEELVGVELLYAKVKLDKPIYCGMAILDISKHAMYDFFYNYLKKRYQDDLTLLMTDTDSLLFYCETENIYSDMLENLHLFDTSSFAPDNRLHSMVNAKVLGKMKDETSGVPIREFVGLRAKAYSFIVDSKEEKKAKGVSKATVKNILRYDTYKDTLMGEMRVFSTMSSIRSHSHQLYCEKLNKCSLSAYDDKRYLLDAVNSLPYGDYRIKQNKL